MVEIDKAVIAKIRKAGENFEILVDCDKALDLKDGKNIDIEDIVAEHKVFADSKKGLLATETKFKDVFGTEDFSEIAKQIIIQGEIQVTADRKRKMLEEKRNRIIGTIASNAVDAQTKLPIPRQRIELAFEELKIKINEHESDEHEIEKILKQMRTLIPIKFDILEVEIRLKANFASKGFGIIKDDYPNAHQIWDEDGNLFVKCKVPAGKVDMLRDKLNSLTHGSVSFKLKE